MSSFKLLVGLLKEQCTFEKDEEDGEKISVKLNWEIPSDSLQNPSDPDAGYDVYKGKGNQAQICGTFTRDQEGSSLSLITHVSVEPADQSDANALLPALRVYAKQ